MFNINFSLQDQGKGDQIDAFQNRIKFWLNVMDGGRVQYLIMFMILILTHPKWIIIFFGAESDPELRESKKFLINDSANN